VDLYLAPPRGHTSKALRYMARVLNGSHSFTCTPRVHPLTDRTIPAFAFPAEAGIPLPTSEGWKAELALVGCTGAALLEYNEVSAKRTTANGGTFTSS